MKINNALLICLFLLFSLIICYIFNHKSNREWFSTNNISDVYIGPNGATATITTTDGIKTLVFKQPNEGSETIILSQTSSDSNKFTNASGFYAENINGNIVIYTPHNGPTFTFIPNNTNTNTDYNHYTSSTIFYGPNGGTANIVTNSDGTKSLYIIETPGGTPIIFTSSSKEISYDKFYGPNGGTATIVTGNNGQVIHVKTASGTVTYTQIKQDNGNGITSTQYFGSTGTPIQSSSYSLAYTPNINSNENTAYYNTNTSIPPNNYSNALPSGIPASQIAPGKEDLYILKSEIVPPVCPVCPSSSASCPREKPCAPCPACARCPEPAFECKKVPNYNAIDNDSLPIPVLNNFSSFGM